MHSAFRLVGKYLKYYVSASNGRGHGIHSPFVYAFVKEVLRSRSSDNVYESIEGIRARLLKDSTFLEVDDFGAGSSKGLSSRRMIRTIASTSLKSPRYAQLLFRMAAYYRPKVLLELGTSLGITTSYLSRAVPESKVFTLEGSGSVAERAEIIFKEQQLKNITLLKGSFEKTLPDLISALPKIDFVFMDGHHQYEATIRYFEWILPKLQASSIIVLDDIHWSNGMEKAWDEIRRHPRVSLSIDLFFIGILFFRTEQFQPEHFVIRF
jgi:predicted O-methyltransferase YrrM